MSEFSHHGYGYSKNLCEDVTSWFLSTFFPRHKIDLVIIHRGLRREKVWGYCDVVDERKLPRQFIIELCTYMDEELYIKTLFHELTHLAQWVRGSLRVRYGKMCYSKEPVEKWDYWHQPHEIEAREEEERLYEWYLIDKQGVPAGKVSTGLPNRLCGAV
jgi:hypothetical protein|tara:strand:+ start:280 stop:756 length:477 start_codon:yes stop_codon:yes gene_type:complete